MIRIVHLLDHDAGFEATRCADHLRCDLGEQFQIERRTIGRGGQYRDPLAAGLALRRQPIASDDILHAWGIAALTAAAIAGRGRILYSPAPDPPAFVPRAQRQIQWLRAVIAHRDVHVICPTTTLRRAHVERGVPLQRCHLIRPGVEFKRINRRRDPALRARLGFNDEDHVLLAAGESTRPAAHHHAVWAASILHSLDPRNKLLVWGRGECAPAVETFARRINATRFCESAERRLARSVEFEALLPAADSVLLSATGAVSTLPVAICMAAALPIVGTVTYTLSELLEDRHTALLVKKRSPRLLAQRVLDLRDDSRLQWSIADIARTEAFEYFALTRLLNQWRQLYRQAAAGEKIELPDLPPGAGLRFHGRA